MKLTKEIDRRHKLAVKLCKLILKYDSEWNGEWASGSLVHLRCGMGLSNAMSQIDSELENGVKNLNRILESRRIRGLRDVPQDIDEMMTAVRPFHPKGEKETWT